jgi:hypothetical protein
MSPHAGLIVIQGEADWTYSFPKETWASILCMARPKKPDTSYWDAVHRGDHKADDYHPIRLRRNKCVAPSALVAPMGVLWGTAGAGCDYASDALDAFGTAYNCDGPSAFPEVTDWRRNFVVDYEKDERPPWFEFVNEFYADEAMQKLAAGLRLHSSMFDIADGVEDADGIPVYEHEWTDSWPRANGVYRRTKKIVPVLVRHEVPFTKLVNILAVLDRCLPK